CSVWKSVHLRPPPGGRRFRARRRGDRSRRVVDRGRLPGHPGRPARGTLAAGNARVARPNIPSPTSAVEIHVGVYDEFTDQPALYALGALTAAERAAFEAHLTVCAACAAEVRAFAPVVEALAATTPDAVPAADVRRALLSR